MYDFKRVNRTVVNLHTYHHVTFVGNCSSTATPLAYTQQSHPPSTALQLTTIVLSFTAFCVSLVSIGVFQRLVNRGVDLGVSSGCPSRTRTRKEVSSTSAGSAGRGRRGSPQSALLVRSLRLLCASECLFTFAAATSAALFLANYLTDYIAKSDPPARITDQPWARITAPSSALLAYPIVYNFFRFLRQTGLKFRNACVCIVMAARAETVLWAIPHRRVQQIMRQPRSYTISVTVTFITCALLAGLRHAMHHGVACYDFDERHYAVWESHYIWTLTQCVAVEAALFFATQCVIVWLLILLFSFIIIVKLKPWQRTTIFDRAQASVVTTSDGNTASYRRRAANMRASRIVLLITLSFTFCDILDFIVQLLVITSTLPEGNIGAFLVSLAHWLEISGSFSNICIFLLTFNGYRDQLFLMCSGGKVTRLDDPQIVET